MKAKTLKEMETGQKHLLFDKTPDLLDRKNTQIISECMEQDLDKQIDLDSS